MKILRRSELAGRLLVVPLVPHAERAAEHAVQGLQHGAGEELGAWRAVIRRRIKLKRKTEGKKWTHLSGVDTLQLLTIICRKHTAHKSSLVPHARSVSLAPFVALSPYSRANLMYIM